MSRPMISFGLCLVVALALSSAGILRAQTTDTSAKAAAPINLNTATAAQLASLPGIGERTAQRIIEFREKNGPFKKSEDLMNVQGIGEKSFLRLKSLVTVTPPKTERAASPGASGAGHE